MKINFLLSVLSGFFGSALLLVALSATGTVGARNADNRATARGAMDVSAAPAAPSGSAVRLTYQGRLTNSGGAPLTTAVNMVFKLYDASSVLLWTSATRSVTPVNGLFTVYLGDGSDPDLNDSSLPSAASIGVTVGSDPEMTPRQPINTVVGHNEAYFGVMGSSNTGFGAYGTSNTGAGVLGRSNNISGTGVAATGGGPGGTALQIYNGGIKVLNAGMGTDTPAFVHVATAGNIYNGDTVIDNSLTNNDPFAILIVTPVCNYGLSQSVCPNSAPVAVFYNYGTIGYPPSRWIIYNYGQNIVATQQFNVLVVKP